jgi:hypothetical protein
LTLFCALSASMAVSICHHCLAHSHPLVASTSSFLCRRALAQ